MEESGKQFLKNKYSVMNIRAQEKAIEKGLTRYWSHKMTLEPEMMLKWLECPEKEDICKFFMKSSGKKWKYFMVTINFKEGVDIEICKKKLAKCLKKKWIVRADYCWEWRDRDKGMHIHMRVEPSEDKKIYDCKREIYNTFKHLVGNRMHVDMRYSNREDCFFDYLAGIKAGEKKKNFDIDIEMRIKYGLAAA